MAIVGQNDAFERRYMEKFRAFASEFGEFVKYERDRGARDIGIHLTHKLHSGQERMSSALCWFQMKGIMAKSLSADGFHRRSHITLSLEVKHLRYWFLQPMPTYLAVYVESVDQFLILNIRDYITKHWGRGILSLQQKTVVVRVPTDSVLDEQAFNLILVKSDIAEWKKVLDAEETDLRLCRRDYDLIWHLGTTRERRVKHRVVFWDWQSKTRSQFYIQERLRSGRRPWKALREHWEYMMSIDDLESAYPYVEFFSLEEDDDDNGESDEVPPVTLANGDVVYGENFCDEYFEYRFGARLNDLGLDMYSWIHTLVEVGLIEITRGKSEFISVAPWHHREV